MGMNLLPLCTASVCPTNSGSTVQRRAQVLSTRFSPLRFNPSIFFTRESTTYGPFLMERAIVSCSPYFFRRRTMSESLSLRRRVLRPLVILPHGEHGCRPPELLPSPPPIGWSTGFIATPRTLGRRPSHRDFPALPITMFWWSSFPTWPIVQYDRSGTFRISLDGRRRTAWSPSFAISWQNVPAPRAI